MKTPNGGKNNKRHRNRTVAHSNQYCNFRHCTWFGLGVRGGLKTSHYFFVTSVYPKLPIVCPKKKKKSIFRIMPGKGSLEMYSLGSCLLKASHRPKVTASTVTATLFNSALIHSSSQI